MNGQQIRKKRADTDGQMWPIRTKWEDGFLGPEKPVL